MPRQKWWRRPKIDIHFGVRHRAYLFLLTFRYFRLTRNHHSVASGSTCDFCCLQFRSWLCRLVRNGSVVVVISQRPCLNREVDVFGYFTGRLRKFQCIWFLGNYPNNVAASIEQWSTTVTRLNWGADLKVAG